MNRIRELRKQKKMTQKELANHLQIADSTLSYWEMGKYEPDFESLKSLSRFFHVPIDYIIGEDFKETEPTGDDAPYKYEVNTMSSASALSVKESQPEYETYGLQGMFDRKEFENLTQDEVEKLAEYAKFIKTLREKGAVDK